MIQSRLFPPALALAATLLASACFPGERPTAIHLECDDSGCHCEAGFADCDGDPSTGCELPTASDPNNCGGCAVQCHSTCAAGQCATNPCDSGFADCHDAPGCESDLEGDADHCGSCDHSCFGGTCSAGHCEPYELVDRGFYALSLAAGETHLYFCETISGTIMAAPLDRGDVEVVAADQNCGWIDYGFSAGLLATGGGHVYWTTGRWLDAGYQERLHAQSLSSGQRWVIPLSLGADGPCCTPQGGPGCLEDAAIESCVCADDPFCCDTDWDSTCTGEVVSLDCGTCAPELSHRAIWATDDQLLVAMADDQGTTHILTMEAGGGDPQVVATTDADVHDLALMADFAYWVEPISLNNDTGIDSIIRRASTTSPGTTESEVFAFGQEIDNVTGAGEHVYWTARDGDQYSILRKGEAGLIDQVHDSKRPLDEVQVDGTHVYWTEDVFGMRVGLYGVALDTGDTTISFTSSHYVFRATSSPTVVAWADYSDRIFGLAKEP
ncbi:MAG: hypothetical protein JRI68_20185 [Deltaproteobacteria bacterium]|nr:hypothetical protein [Deltaproteobacteria bacterium]